MRSGVMGALAIVRVRVRRGELAPAEQEEGAAAQPRKHSWSAIALEWQLYTCVHVEPRVQFTKCHVEPRAPLQKTDRVYHNVINACVS